MVCMIDQHPSHVMIPETLNMLMWPKFRFLEIIQARMKLIKALGWGDVTPASLTRQMSVYVYKYMLIDQCCYEESAWSALPRKTEQAGYMVYGVLNRIRKSKIETCF